MAVLSEIRGFHDSRKEKLSVCWVSTLCSLSSRYTHFTATWCLCLQGGKTIPLRPSTCCLFLQSRSAFLHENEEGSRTVDMPFYPENEYSLFPRNIGAYLPEQTESRLHILPLMSKSLPDPRMEFSLQVTSTIFPANDMYWQPRATRNWQPTWLKHVCIMLSLLAVYRVYRVIRRRMAQDELTRMWKDGFWNTSELFQHFHWEKERKRSSSKEIWGFTEVYIRILVLWGVALFKVNECQYFGVTYVLPPTSGYPENNSIQNQEHHNKNRSGYLVPCHRFKTNPSNKWKSSSNRSSATPVYVTTDFQKWSLLNSEPTGTRIDSVSYTCTGAAGIARSL